MRKKILWLNDVDQSQTDLELVERLHHWATFAPLVTQSCGKRQDDIVLLRSQNQEKI